jgi:hypothetical protein
LNFTRVLEPWRLPHWVKLGNTRCEQMFSALAPTADIDVAMDAQCAGKRARKNMFTHDTIVCTDRFEDKWIP